MACSHHLQWFWRKESKLGIIFKILFLLCKGEKEKKRDILVKSSQYPSQKSFVPLFWCCSFLFFTHDHSSTFLGIIFYWSIKCYCHLGNANQNYNEISPPTCQNVYHQKDHKLMKALCKTVWRVLKKLKMELPYNQTIPFLDIFPKTIKTLIWKDTDIPIFTESLIIIVKI